jgi:hypothetical protein
MTMLIMRRHSNNTTLLKILQISLSLSLSFLELRKKIPVANCSRVLEIRVHVVGKTGNRNRGDLCILSTSKDEY